MIEKAGCANPAALIRRIFTPGASRDMRRWLKRESEIEAREAARGPYIPSG